MNPPPIKRPKSLPPKDKPADDEPENKKTFRITDFEGFLDEIVKESLNDPPEKKDKG